MKLELIPATGGVFEVVVNDTRIYSKQETGKFPDPAFLIEKMENLA